MTLLNEWCEDAGAQVLHVRIGRSWARVGKEVSRLDGDFVQNERAHHTVHRHHAELL